MAIFTQLSAKKIPNKDRKTILFNLSKTLRLTDLNKSIEFLQQSAELGHPEAQAELGMIYY